jgi:hypothetical protein
MFKPRSYGGIWRSDTRRAVVAIFCGLIYPDHLVHCQQFLSLYTHYLMQYMNKTTKSDWRRRSGAIGEGADRSLIDHISTLTISMRAVERFNDRQPNRRFATLRGAARHRTSLLQLFSFLSFILPACCNSAS